MELLKTLAVLLPFSVTSGINFYATVLVLSLSCKLELISNIPEPLQPFNAWPIVILSGIFFLMEFLADKIQFVDNLWDGIHTFIRPIGAGIFALMIMTNTSPQLAVIAALCVGGISFVTHSTKAGGKLILNFFSPAENISNAAISIIGEASVIGLSILTMLNPFIASVIALIILTAIVIYGPKLYRWGFFMIKALFTGILRFFGLKKRKDDDLPEDTEDMIPEVPKTVIYGKASNLRLAKSRSGYLIQSDEKIYFIFKRFFKYRTWELKRNKIINSEITSGVFFDTIKITYKEEDSEKMVSFTFLPNREPIIKRFSEQLGNGLT